MSRSVNFEGLKCSALVTFKSALVKGTDENKLVKASANGTIVLCSEDENFTGIVRIIDNFDKAASVQIDGFVEDYPCDPDFEPVVSDGGGWQLLQCGSDATMVKLATAPEGQQLAPGTIPLRKVVEVDTSAHTLTFQL